MLLQGCVTTKRNANHNSYPTNVLKKMCSTFLGLIIRLARWILQNAYAEVNHMQCESQKSSSTCKNIYNCRNLIQKNGAHHKNHPTTLKIGCFELFRCHQGAGAMDSTKYLCNGISLQQAMRIKNTTSKCKTICFGTFGVSSARGRGSLYKILV